MILPLAITLIIALSGLLLSIIAVFQTRTLLRTSGQRSSELRSQQESRLNDMRASLDSLAADVRGLEAQTGGHALTLKPGLNLSKRSQALRMHRRGEAAAQIASVLDIPPQEVELLIKVQRIVMSNL